MSPAGAHARQAPARRADGAGGRPRLRVVGQGDRAAHRARRRARLGLGGLLLAVFVAAFFHVLLVQAQFALESREVRAREEQERFQRLRLEVAELGAPARIAAEAARLGMVAPGSPVHLTAALPDGQGLAGEGAPRAGADIAQSWSEVKPHLASGP